MLTYERANELFECTDEGHLVRRRTVCGTGLKGTKVGHDDGSGYLRVRVDGSQYLVHRIVFLMAHGYMPENSIDHIDRNKKNNMVSNLREVSRSCNLRNSKLKVDNKSGVRGVYYAVLSGMWVSSVSVDGSHCQPLCTRDFVEAVAHWLALEQSMGWKSCGNMSSASLFMENYIKEVICS